jgi:hypothetical protein
MKPETYVLLILVAVAAVFIVMDWVRCWMERRGWIYWRKKKSTGGGGAMAGILAGFQQIVEPQIEHRQQVMEERNESIGQRLGRGDDIPPPDTQNPPK